MSEDCHDSFNRYDDALQKVLRNWNWETVPGSEPQQIGQPLTPEPEFTEADRRFLKALKITLED